MRQLERASSAWWPPTSRLEPLDLRAQGAQPGVVGAGFGGLDRARRGLLGARVGLGEPFAARPTLQGIELVAQRLVTTQLIEIGGPVAPATASRLLAE